MMKEHYEREVTDFGDSVHKDVIEVKSLAADHWRDLIDWVYAKLERSDDETKSRYYDIAPYATSTAPDILSKGESGVLFQAKLLLDTADCDWGVLGVRANISISVKSLTLFT